MCYVGVVPGVQYTLDHFINVPQINFLCALYPNMFLMYINTLFIINKILLEVSMPLTWKFSPDMIKKIWR